VIKVAVVGLGVTVAVGGVVTAAVASQAAAATHTIRETVNAASAHSVAARPSSTSHGNVGVTVPRITFIKVDRAGHVVLIWTNTGEIPQLTDRFVVVGKGASHAPGDGLVREILSR
jgi:hypothetical protein